MESLTPDQARTLWESGGFALLTGLPEGSEYGIDGTFHTVKRFAGTKFLPPGVHLQTYSVPPSSSSSGSGALPMRYGILHVFKARERRAVSYDPKTEETTLRPEPSTAELRELDPQLAPYPFKGLEDWKALTCCITPEIVEAVLGEEGIVDGLTPADGEVDDQLGLGPGHGLDEGELADLAEMDTTAKSAGLGDDPRGRGKLALPQFDLRRSWADGAVGGDVTRWSQDKSLVWSRIAAECGGPTALVGHLQLAFILIVNVWSYASLAPYKRLLSLLCQSKSATTSPETHNHAGAQASFIEMVSTLAAQLDALPVHAFEVELPDLDVFYQEQIEMLRRNLGAALAEPAWWGLAGRLNAAWDKLEAAARGRGWEIGQIAAGDEDSDEEVEEGEYAPVVVEM